MITRPGALVGATDWCTHPTGLTVARVRGTKNPDIAAILNLAPDLVIATGRRTGASTCAVCERPGYRCG